MSNNQKKLLHNIFSNIFLRSTTVNNKFKGVTVIMSPETDKFRVRGVVSHLRWSIFNTKHPSPTEALPQIVSQQSP